MEGSPVLRSMILFMRTFTYTEYEKYEIYFVYLMTILKYKV